MYHRIVLRTQRSSCAYVGLFPFGWCSQIEAKKSLAPVSTLKILESAYIYIYVLFFFHDESASQLCSVDYPVESSQLWWVFRRCQGSHWFAKIRCVDGEKVPTCRAADPLGCVCMCFSQKFIYHDLKPLHTMKLYDISWYEMIWFMCTYIYIYINSMPCCGQMKWFDAMQNLWARSQVESCFIT